MCVPGVVFILVCPYCCFHTCVSLVLFSYVCVPGVVFIRVCPWSCFHTSVPGVVFSKLVEQLFEHSPLPRPLHKLVSSPSRWNWSKDDQACSSHHHQAGNPICFLISICQTQPNSETAKVLPSR